MSEKTTKKNWTVQTEVTAVSSYEVNVLKHFSCRTPRKKMSPWRRPVTILNIFSCTEEVKFGRLMVLWRWRRQSPYGESYGSKSDRLSCFREYVVELRDKNRTRDVRFHSHGSRPHGSQLSCPTPEMKRSHSRSNFSYPKCSGLIPRTEILNGKKLRVIHQEGFNFQDVKP